jgi:hypothetical protein
VATKTLTVELPEELYREFVGIVGEKGGRWRGEESGTEAIESAVAAALMLFLQGLDGEEKLIELRDHILENFPETN